MLADKTLLGATLFVTFVSGGAVGYVARDARGATERPYAVETVFAHQIADLEGQGYDQAELGEARDLYREYLDEYRNWWDQFVDSHAENLDGIDRRLEERLAELAERHRSRARQGGAK